MPKILKLQFYDIQHKTCPCILVCSLLLSNCICVHSCTCVKKFQEHLYNAKILRKASSCKYHGKVQRMRETVYIRDVRDDDGEELISRKRIKRDDAGQKVTEGPRNAIKALDCGRSGIRGTKREKETTHQGKKRSAILSFASMWRERYNILSLFFPLSLRILPAKIVTDPSYQDSAVHCTTPVQSTRLRDTVHCMCTRQCTYV